MSKYKEQIKNLAWDINDGLSEYIDIHDRIIKEAASFKSFLKNIFSRPVPMSQLLKEAESLMPMWGIILKKISKFYDESYSLIDENEKHYFDILYKYAKSLNQTVVVLVERQILLSERSRGGKNNSVNWKAYQEAENKYESTIQKYKELGEDLNNLNYLIFE